MTFQTVELVISEPLGILTLNRPSTNNALSATLLSELEDALGVLKRDPRVRVVLLSGAGDNFCVGYDLNGDDWILSQYGADFDAAVDPIRDREDVADLVDYWLRLWRFPKPIVAQVQGACLSGGGELIAIADIVVAASDASFGHPAGRDLGIPVTLSLWPMLIGVRKTKELLLTAKIIDGVEAESLGLINVAVPLAELEERARQMALDIARTEEAGARISKLAANRWFENMGLIASCHSTADLDAFFHQSPSYVSFFQTVRDSGTRAALTERRQRYG